MTKSRNKYQDIGCSKYIYITEGGNCEICDSLDGHLFSISEARPGINFAPIRPHCDCAAGILDDNGNIVSLIGNENNNNLNDKEIEIIRNFVSAGIGFIPVIGDIKDIQEALTGIDLITGKKLSTGERALTALTIFIPVVNGKAVREAFGLVDDVADAVKGIKKAAKSLDDTTDAVKGVGKAADDVAKGTGKVDKNLKPQDLMDELAQSGVKYTPEDVVTVTKTPDGKLMWLEKGNASSGLKHIVDGHAIDFANRGIADIPDFKQGITRNPQQYRYRQIRSVC